jgi:hypothetical protein
MILINGKFNMLLYMLCVIMDNSYLDQQKLLNSNLKPARFS